MTSETTKDTGPFTCTAFRGTRRIASGPLPEVALKVKKEMDKRDHPPILIFNDLTSDQLEIDFRGLAEDVLERLSTPKPPPRDQPSPPVQDTPRGPGRPRLGVIGREVTLLPRHWEWLDTQPGGASVTLRKLAETAKRASTGADRRRRAQEAAYKFILAMGGNFANFEEASRVLFSKEPAREKRFQEVVQGWPADVRNHATRLMKATVEAEDSEPPSGGAA